ncbi:biotin synthase BioB [Thermanaerosceptrum fracticalcis]|uniref:Biotin synthase n=1 Tax=Thermanaerosceptrum fracticalcis TaxID=1712410 RepID=A0A7G6DYN1_THEFR|nr:biotin synthase BioB [Thermanaerosceptrum fracticalcis]QNB44935.1 biotin synthase BioB [Thermanaerosceptrum fracticalcis]
MNVEKILVLGNKVLAGESIDFTEAVALSKTEESDIPFLTAMANKIRQQFVGNEVDLCSIVNGRSGMCSENCSFCAQSAHHKAQIEVYPLMEEDKLLKAALEAETNGALRFSIVTSGHGVAYDQDLPRIIKGLQRIKAETNLKLCASLGTLTLDQALQLKEAGVERYHHNVESSRSFYPSICTTHTYDERIHTIRVAHQAGLEVCSGGIIGLGETMLQRIEMAFELKELGVHSVPVNILNPIKGTPLENQSPLQPLEILKTFALFRFILPDRGIRTAGGREVNLRDLQATALLSGINGMLIGGYLTTGGRNCAMDLKMIRDLGLKPLSAVKKDKC